MAISKQSNGKWRADFNYKGFDGKRHRKVKVFTTKTEANVWLATQQVSESNNASKQKDMPFIDYFNEYAEVHLKSGLKESTIASWEHVRDNVVPVYFTNLALSELTRNIYQNFINEHSTGKAKSTVKVHHLIIKSVIQQAFHDGIIDVDPTYKIRLIGNDSKSAAEKFLEADEFKSLIDHLTSNKSYLNTKSTFLIYLVALSGMRVGEALALAESDFNIEARTISITKTKQRSGQITTPKTKTSTRKIKMPDVFFKNYSDYVSSIGSDHLFGDTSDPTYLNKKLHRISEQLGFKNSISIHGLRHSHASFLLTHGVDISYVSQRLGHADVSLTMRVYAHLLNQLKEQEEEKTINILG